MRFVKGKDNIEDTLAGYDSVADIVGATLGPNGRNVRFRKDGKTYTTNDGVTIAKIIGEGLGESPEALAAEELIAAAEETNNIAGDGTTTTIVLTRAMAHAAIQAEHENPFILRQELSEALTLAEAHLTASATKLTADRVLDVARVSVGGNEKLAQVVATAIRRVGTGPITIESQEKLGIDIEVSAGLMQVGGTPFTFLGGEESVTLHNVPILVVNGELATVSFVKPMLDKLLENKITQVAIAATEFSTPMLNFFVSNWDQMQVMPLIVNQPRAVAEATKATLVDKVGSATYENISVAHLGAAKRITTEEAMSLIVGTSKTGKNKTAVIKAGFPTAVEYNEIRDRLEDAINAVRSAKAEGVLIGGGVALLDASMALDKTTKGAKVLAHAMAAPHRQIRENGFSGTVDPGVIDPLKVVLTALRVAVSTVKTAIATEVTLWNPEEGNDYE